MCAVRASAAARRRRSVEGSDTGICRSKMGFDHPKIMPLCPAAAAHVLVKLASYKGSLTCFERPIKTQWHTWVYKQAIIALLDTGTPLLVQHENLKLHHFTSNLLKTNANCMHKPNKSILYLKFVDWSIPARARRRPAMGTGQLRSPLAAAASLCEILMTRE